MYNSGNATLNYLARKEGYRIRRRRRKRIMCHKKKARTKKHEKHNSKSTPVQ